MVRKTSIFVAGIILMCLCIHVHATGFSSRAASWPPISTYEDMALHDLSFEISMMRKDLEYYKKRNDQKSITHANEAYNRLNVLFLIYSKRSGRPLEVVREMYGNPSRY